MTLPHAFTFSTNWFSLPSSILLSKLAKRIRKSTSSYPITSMAHNCLQMCSSILFKKCLPTQNFSPPTIPHSALQHFTSAPTPRLAPWHNHPHPTNFLHTQKSRQQRNNITHQHHSLQAIAPSSFPSQPLKRFNQATKFRREYGLRQSPRQAR